MTVEVRELAAPTGVAASDVLAELRERLTVVADPPTANDRTYLDTFDWRIFSSGASLHAERAGERAGLWLTAPGAPALHAAGGASTPLFPRDLAPGALRDRLAALSDVRALLPVARVRVTSTALRVLNGDGKTVARLTLEEPRVVGDGSRALRPQVALGARAVLTPVRGYAKAAARVAAALADTGLVPTTANALADITAPLPRRAGGYSSKVAVPLDPRAPAADAVRTVLRALLAAMRANERGVRDDIDPEFLHDYRVAVRRTRSALKSLQATLPAGEVARFREGFKWLGDATTPTCDLDVHLLSMQDYRVLVADRPGDPLGPLQELLERRQHDAHTALVRAMRTTRYRTLLTAWEAFLAASAASAASAAGDGDDRGADAATPVKEVADRRIAKAHRTVLGRGRAITPASPAEALHDLRKRAKELRYLLELFAGLYPRAAVNAVVRDLKALQDNLGDFQDFEVQRGVLTAAADELVAATVPASTVMAIGEVVADLGVRQRRAHDDFSRRFAAFDSRAARTHLRDMLRAAP